MRTFREYTKTGEGKAIPTMVNDVKNKLGYIELTEYAFGPFNKAPLGDFDNAYKLNGTACTAPGLCTTNWFKALFESFRSSPPTSKSPSLDKLCEANVAFELALEAHNSVDMLEVASSAPGYHFYEHFRIQVKDSDYGSYMVGPELVANPLWASQGHIAFSESAVCSTPPNSAPPIAAHGHSSGDGDVIDKKRSDESLMQQSGVVGSKSQAKDVSAEASNDRIKAEVEGADEDEDADEADDEEDYEDDDEKDDEDEDDNAASLLQEGEEVDDEDEDENKGDDQDEESASLLQEGEEVDDEDEEGDEDEDEEDEEEDEADEEDDDIFPMKR